MPALTLEHEHELRLDFDDVVSDDRRWSTFSGAPVFGGAATATTGPATAATPRPAAATSGAPTVAASGWASSKSGGNSTPTSSPEAATNSCQPTWPPFHRTPQPQQLNTDPLRFPTSFTLPTSLVVFLKSYRLERFELKNRDLDFSSEIFLDHYTKFRNGIFCWTRPFAFMLSFAH